MAVGGNSEILLQCYNFGCGKTFNPETITDTSCCFHPGAPVFHDALKGWSCCKKRTTDFTEFMNIPGCTRGRCSNVKPEVPVKEVAELKVQEVVNKPIEKPEVRPSIDEERKVMKIVTKSSYNQKKVDAKVADVVSDEIKIGTTCFNKGCNKEYTNTDADNQVCVHHPGQVVFHDGLKFWSCCKRKTTDFNAFLQQKGCTNGRCKWKRDAAEVEKVNCRHDWHQTGNYVTLSIYAKLANALTSTFKLNQVSVQCSVTFDGGKQFDVAFELDGVVNVQESKVTISGTKVEVQMRKKRIQTWKEFATEIEEEEEEKDIGGEECGEESCGRGGEFEGAEGKKAEEDKDVFKDVDDQYYDVGEDDFDDIDTIEFD